MGRIKRKLPEKVQNYFSSVISGIRSPKIRQRSHRRKQVSESASEYGLISTSATLDDIDRYLFENFRSLYGETEKEDSDMEEELPEIDDSRSSLEIQLPALIDLRGSNRFFITPVSSGSLIEEVRSKLDDSGFESFALKIDFSEDLGRNRSLDDRYLFKRVPDFDDARSSLEIQLPALIDLHESNRFFITPVSSGSLIEEARSKSFNFGPLRNRAFEDCVPVVTVSVSPYHDFLRSMADVMNAGAKQGRGVDWEFMEELLFSYLRLNEKEHYKYVLKAFVDLVSDSRQGYGSGYGGEPELLSV